MRFLRSFGFSAIIASLIALSSGESGFAQTFTFRLPGEPATLDWNRAHSDVETHVLMNLMEGLVAFDKSLKIVPALAERWTRSDDGRTYTFHLRKTAKWSDGVSVRAQDFVYSWKRLLSPFTAASYAYFLFDIEGAEYFNQGKIQDFSDVGVKALDDSTLQVKLARPVAHWLYMPTFWVTFPMREDVVTKHGEGWARPGRMVTTGPFTLASYEAESKVVLRSNPYYYGRRGNIQEVVGMIVRDDQTALTLYEGGKFDFIADVSAMDASKMKGRSDLVTFPYLKTQYVGFGVGKYPASLAGVRKAIGMAIDRSRLPQILMGGQKVASSFVSPGVLGYGAQLGLKFDPAKARQELVGAGFGPGRPLKLELLCQNWDKMLVVAQFIQSELKKNIGIDVVISPFDNKTFRQHLNMGAYPMFLAAWGADYPDPDNYLSILLSTSGNNRSKWKNKAFDDRVLEARNILDVPARTRAYLETQQLVQETEAVMVPLYYEANVTLLKPRVKNLVLNPLNYLYLKDIQLGP